MTSAPGQSSGAHSSRSQASGSQASDAEMRAQLEKLPPGHPSSPWNADGRRKPPPPRLQDLELPLPGTWPDELDDPPPIGPDRLAAPASENFQNDGAAREPAGPGDAS